MSQKLSSYIFLATCILILSGCKDRHVSTMRSAYYWSTTWECDSALQTFIHDNEIGRIYLRYFDVVVDDNGDVMPNATIRFASPLPPNVEIVPTVYIVNNCLSKETKNLDQLILKRVLQMSETHDVAGVKEIQIDCDWSMSTRKTYFEILSNLRDSLHDKGLKLSATIRLHQLSEAPPPVDKGVLMMYNTGDLRKRDHNPILDLDDAAPYLKHLDSYQLPLSTAYPVFSLSVLWRGNHLVGIMHDDDLPMFDGDTLITYEAELETVQEAKNVISRLKTTANDETILFEISKNNMKRINKSHYEKIYNH